MVLVLWSLAWTRIDFLLRVNIYNSNNNKNSNTIIITNIYAWKLIVITIFHHNSSHLRNECSRGWSSHCCVNNLGRNFITKYHNHGYRDIYIYGYLCLDKMTIQINGGNRLIHNCVVVEFFVSEFWRVINYHSCFDKLIFILTVMSGGTIDSTLIPFFLPTLTTYLK